MPTPEELASLYSGVVPHDPLSPAGAVALMASHTPDPKPGLLQDALLGQKFATGAGPNGEVTAAPPLPGTPAAAMPGTEATQVVPEATPEESALQKSIEADRAQGQSLAAGGRDAIQGVDEVRLGALHAAYRAQDELAAAQKKHDDAKAELLGHTNDAAKEQLDHQAQRRAEFEKTARAAQMKADQLSDEALHAEIKDFWADKSTPSRILGILAQTLSGAANGLAGTPGAETPLDRIIAADAERQRHNQANKQAGAIRAAGALGQIYNNYHDETEAENTAMLARYKWADRAVDRLDALMGGEQAPANAKAAKAVLANKMADLKENAGNKAIEIGDRERASAQDNLLQLHRDKTTLEVAGLRNSQGFIKVPGVQGVHRKELFGQAAQKMNADFATTFAQLDNIEALAKKSVTDPSAWAGAKASDSLLGGSTRGILGTGANLSEKEFADVQAIRQKFLGNKLLSEVSPTIAAQYIQAVRQALATSYRARTRAVYGQDIDGTAPGFESAAASLAQSDAERAK